MMLNRFLFVGTLFFFIPLFACAQQKDSTSLVKDSTTIMDSTLVSDSATLNSSQKINDSTDKRILEKPSTGTGLNSILNRNIFLQSNGKSITFIQNARKKGSKDVVFYALAILIMFFAFLKFLYPRYFSNLFRVFFNTSLRQGQLTDQLLQAKLPSLLFNIFFILTGGGYLYLLLNFFGKTEAYSKWQVFIICAIFLLTIYLAKFCILKFTGWITGFKQEADTYIFIIFLINKIMAICLVPFIIIIAFSDKELVDIAILLSYIIIAVMILMRFFRSYSLLQNRIKVSRFHFFIYIIGIEIIPLTVIYKLALFFMSKNL
jgi:hypothetical protein